jgi:hypothetical protein
VLNEILEKSKIEIINLDSKNENNIGNKISTKGKMDLKNGLIQNRFLKEIYLYQIVIK